jgi:NtrC-family two-component system response regulator AlgB
MTTLDALESEHIARVIKQSATMEEAAKILGIDPATLYRKRKKMAVDPAEDCSSNANPV